MTPRAGFLIWGALLTLGLGGFVANGVETMRLARENATVRALSAGRDAPVSPYGAPHPAHARALFLLARDRIEPAEALMPAVSRGPASLAAGAQLTLGNGRMRRAFMLIEAARRDEAIPQVQLAKAAYRAALKAEPGLFDAKVNLDLAQRLVRDLPRVGQDGTEDPENRPRKVWTDLPGMPRGAP
ncbi:hypothetical protein [Rubrimonas cliftonensis]|uniref:MxaK protein n=1 Tax=Rubrimonas cliftonensis TaxID=89524 RepID=A0A1H4FJF8_9RHOB|nr:hypothetical protein [Rubrimonas cliftonensis]SEA96632.1 mxaK protein [Rubrimonas cliftonensis]